MPLLHVLALVIVFAGALLPAPVALRAQDLGSAPATTPSVQSALGGALQYSVDGNGARFTLQPALAADVQETLAAFGATTRYQGYDLPIAVVPLRVGSADTPIQFGRVESIELPAGVVVPGAPLELGNLPLDAASAAAIGESFDPATDPATTGAQVVALPEEPLLPDAPIFVLRSGELNGVPTIVLAISPIYAEGGVTRFATSVEAFVSGAQPVSADALAESPAEAAATWGATSAAGLSPDMVEACANYTLPLVDSGEKILRVSKTGLQSVARSSLGSMSGMTAAQLSLTRNGVRVPVQIVGGELRFYAPSVGDRWNPTDAYILRPASTQFPALPMGANQAVSTVAAGAASQVLDEGTWRNNLLYSSLYKGADSDHWSAGDIWINPTAPQPANRQSAPVTAVLNDSALLNPPNKLPLVGGASDFTFAVSPYKRASNSPRLYTLVARDGGATNEVDFPFFATINSKGDWPAGLTESATFASNPASLVISLSPVGTNTAPSGLLIDSISYSRPASLALGGNGAIFRGTSAQTQYRWSGAASGFLLYDVTDPNAPVQLTGATANGFTDGRGAGKRYLVTGAGFLHTPTVEVKYLQNYSALTGVQAIYIVAGSDFATALKPLADLRCESYKVAVVDVRAIYNRYSHGQVSAEAVRNFLRDAWYDGSEAGAPAFNFFTWDPISVVLVGDATYDPWNYTRKTGKNYNLVPAWMGDEIDPYIGEAACDPCFGQLNGNDPHTGDATTARPGLFTMEIYVGRLPANSASEVTEVAAKIVRYETTGSDHEPWRGNMLFVADNYWRPTGNTFTQDPAGNFARTSDDLRSIYMTGHNESRGQRSYWDPAPQLNVPSAVGQSWRANTRPALATAMLSALNSKPALVLYNGHANHFYMGSTEPPAVNSERDYVMMFQDVGQISNINEAFMLLSMTCQTSQFVVPTDGGRTIDENYLLNGSSGAIATWGSTGLSPVVGHEVLQEGYLRQLLSRTTPQSIGVLLRAGYENVILHGVNADDILRTFMLMGDPLTKFRFNPSASALYLPIIDGN